jgi:nitroreductase
MADTTIDLLLRRRSVLAKDLGDPGPDQEALETILRAGIRVPDHGRTEPWRIQILRENARRALGDLFGEIYQREHPDAADAVLAAERERPLRGPVLLAVSFHPDPTKYDKVPRTEQLLSAGAMCQNILIACEALGFNVQWLTGWPAYHPQVREALGHSSDTEIIGFLHIGTAARPPSERPRPDFAAIVSEWTPPSRPGG